MSKRKHGLRRFVRAVSSGALAFALANAVADIDWAQTFTNFLGVLFSAILTVLFGGQLPSVISQQFGQLF